MVESGPHQQVGYILRSYPRLSQTFILNEILALERLGLEIQIFAITDPQEAVVQEQVPSVRAQVYYLDQSLRQPWWLILFRHISIFLASPIRYLSTLVSILKSRYMNDGYHQANRFECFSLAIYLTWLLRQNQSRIGRTIDHLHAHFAHDPTLVALLVHRLSGIPYSFTAHARDLYQIPLRTLIERSKQAVTIVTCCRANLNYLTQALPVSQQNKVRLIYHGVDLETFVPLKGGQPFPERPFILSVGRLVEKKGFSILLCACHLLKQMGVDFKVMIFGDGPLREQLIQQIAQYGLDEQVTLESARKNLELVPIFQKASMFALTPIITEDGDRDGIPNVLVEAMACGLPVISTAVGGISELLRHNHNGLLFDPGNVQGIASGLALLLKDPARRKRLGTAARKTVEKNFDLQAGVIQMAELFQQLGRV